MTSSTPDAHAEVIERALKELRAPMGRYGTKIFSNVEARPILESLAAEVRRAALLPIHLEITPDGWAAVRIEVAPQRWVEVIRNFHSDGGHTSHIVEPRGIQGAIDRALAQGERRDG